MIGPNTNAQGLRESLVVYGSARITEGGAPILLQLLGAHLYGPRLRVSSTGTARKAGLHHTRCSRTDERNRSLDRERTVIGGPGGPHIVLEMYGLL
jgi:hypothetical protein